MATSELGDFRSDFQNHAPNLAGEFMSIFEKQRGTLVPVHADNANTRDWLVLLEAATIVGHQRDKLRVALTTQERKVVKKRKLFR
ncbi:MAG TPA: hypothetical protein VF396_07335, partial [Bradyrhizobium sp.]